MARVTIEDCLKQEENRYVLIHGAIKRTIQLKKGATALTESWQALPNVSNNHFMLGHLMEWFYAGLAGIKQSSNSVAFNKIEIKPQVVGDVTYAKAKYNSPYGEIVSEWKLNGNSFELNVTIPANTEAAIHLPVDKKSVIRQNGKVLVAKLVNGKAVVNVGSGKYLFQVY